MIKKPLIIAEIGINHQGDLQIAHDMIKTAAQYCKCDYVKFQKRDLTTLSLYPEYQKPHPDVQNAFGETYLLHKKALEFSLEQHKQLQRWCKDYDIGYACSVWDLVSAEEIISLEPDYIKVPSALNNNFDLLRFLCNNYNKDIHVSLGMTTEDETYSILDLFKVHNRHRSLVLYACTSSYPCNFEDVCLLEIKKLKHLLDCERRFKEIGLSAHYLGTGIDLAAVTLGANYIERHFTLNRAWKGSDQSSSLEPEQLRRLVRDRDNLFKALTYKEKSILDCELSSYKKLKRGL